MGPASRGRSELDVGRDVVTGMRTELEQRRHELDERLGHALTHAARLRVVIAGIEEHIARLGITPQFESALSKLRAELMRHDAVVKELRQ